MRWLLRPFKRRLAGFLTGCLGRALDERNLSLGASEELSLVLDTLIAEHFRLQEQVETLRRQVEASLSSPAGSR